VREPMLPSTKLWLADPFNFGEGKMETWRAPDPMPELAAVQLAIDQLEWRLSGAGEDGVAVIFKALLDAGLAMAADDPSNMDTKMAIYQAALSDMPADLMEAAFMRCIKESQFFPQVAVFRKSIDAEFSERKRMLDRAKRMRELILNPPGPNGSTFQPEAPHVHTAGLVASFTRNGMPGRAAAHVRTLWEMSEAERATGSPAQWAIDGYVDVTLKKRDGRKWIDDPVRVMIEPPKFEDLQAPVEPLPATFEEALAGRHDDGDQSGTHTGSRHKDNPREEPPPRSEDDGGAQPLDW